MRDPRGLAPQVRRRAAERVLLTADEAIQVIKSFISDPTVLARRPLVINGKLSQPMSSAIATIDGDSSSPRADLQTSRAPARAR